MISVEGDVETGGEKSTESRPKRPHKAYAARMSEERIAEALVKSAGLYTPAAQLLGCERSSIHKRVAKSQALQDLCAKIKEQTIDLAEHRLMEHIRKGSLTAIIFYLKCQAKPRGYVERQEVSGPNGGPMQQQIAWVDVDRHRAVLEEIERDRRARPERYE